MNWLRRFIENLRKAFRSDKPSKTQVSSDEKIEGRRKARRELRETQEQESLREEIDNSFPKPEFTISEDEWADRSDENSLSDSGHWTPYWELKKSLRTQGILGDTVALVELEEKAVRAEGFSLRKDAEKFLRDSGVRQ